jgi:hypothetical protein
MSTWPSQNHERWKAGEVSPDSVPQSLSVLETEADRARRTLSILNLKMKLAAELERELFMVRYNRWYRRLWRYLQAMWWSILDFDYNKVMK